MSALIQPADGTEQRGTLLAEADRVVASLSPGKREAVREIVIDATRRGLVTASARRFLDTASGSSLLSDVLTAALVEGSTTRPEPALARTEMTP